MTTLRPELPDELLADYDKPEDLLGEERLFKQLKKALLERALGAELSEHLGYEKDDPAGRGTGNSRNGYTDKTVLTEDGEIDIAVPRDRNGTFEPLIVPKSLSPRRQGVYLKCGKIPNESRTRRGFPGFRPLVPVGKIFDTAAPAPG